MYDVNAGALTDISYFYYFKNHQQRVLLRISSLGRSAPPPAHNMAASDKTASNVSAHLFRYEIKSLANLAFLYVHSEYIGYNGRVL